MINLIRAEWMKLKRSKSLPVFLLIVIVATPILAALGITNVTGGSGRHYAEYLLQHSLKDNCIYFCTIFAPPVIALFSILIFSREYSDGTIKTLSSVPVGIVKLISAKLIVILIFSLICSVFTWLCTALGSVCFDSDYDLSRVWENTAYVLTYLGKFLLAGLLAFLAVFPIICLTVLIRGLILPTLITVLLTIASFFLFKVIPGDLFYFWTCSRYLLDDQAHFAVWRWLSIPEAGVNWIASLLVIIPAVLSCAISYLAMKYKDVT